MSEVYLQPGADPAVHTVPAERGMAWLQSGWRQFLSAPGLWVLVSLVLMLIHGVLSMIPFVGGVASILLAPVFGGGLMAGCAAIDRGEPLRFDHLFVGFKENSGNLLFVGVVQLIGLAAIMLMVFLVGGGAIMGGVLGQSTGDGLGATVALGGMLLAALLAAALLVPLTMALWFSPALVMLSGMAPMAAMKASISGCARNWLVFLVYSILAFVLFIVALIPLGLGLLVLVPVLVASVYFSYREIFY